MLRAAMVRMQAAKAKSFRCGDSLRQALRRRTRCDAAAICADVDFNVDVE